MNPKKTGLGKGLGALIGNAQIEQESGVIEIDILKIEPGKNQPRTHFDQEALAELACSIKEFGVISPILVKQEGEYYSIIAGERRWRAARLCGLETIPAIIKELNGADAVEVALIENIQREDLNPIEEARCYNRLIEEFNMTHEALAQRLGKSRPAITNSLRLLSINEALHTYIMDGRLSVGHAKLLVPLAEDVQIAVSQKIIEGELSVRETEKLIKALQNPPEEKPKENRFMPFVAIEDELGQVLRQRVRVIQLKGKKSGKIEIDYSSLEELDRLYLALKRVSED